MNESEKIKWRQNNINESGISKVEIPNQGYSDSPITLPRKERGLRFVVNNGGLNLFMSYKFNLKILLLYHLF